MTFFTNKTKGSKHPPVIKGNIPLNVNREQDRKLKDKLMKHIDELQKQLVEQKAINQAIEEHRRQAGEIATLSEINKNLLEKNVELMERIDHLEAEVATNNNSSVDEDVEIDAVQNTITVLTQLLDESRAEKESLRNQLSEITGILEELYLINKSILGSIDLPKLAMDVSEIHKMTTNLQLISSPTIELSEDPEEIPVMAESKETKPKTKSTTKTTRRRKSTVKK